MSGRLIELAERLEMWKNWAHEESDNWKTGTWVFDRAPFEAAAALRECAKQEPVGYLDRYNVFYPKAFPTFYLRPVYAAPVPPIDREELDHAVLKAWLSKHRGRTNLVVDEDAELTGEQREQIGRAIEYAAPGTPIDREAILKAADEMAQRLADYLYAHGSGGDVRDEYTAARARLVELLGVKDE